MADFRVEIDAVIVAEIEDLGPDDSEKAGQLAIFRAAEALRYGFGFSLREPVVREIARVDREGETK